MKIAHVSNHPWHLDIFMIMAFAHGSAKSNNGELSCNFYSRMTDPPKVNSVLKQMPSLKRKN